MFWDKDIYGMIWLQQKILGQVTRWHLASYVACTDSDFANVLPKDAEINAQFPSSGPHGQYSSMFLMGQSKSSSQWKDKYIDIHVKLFVSNVVMWIQQFFPGSGNLEKPVTLAQLSPVWRKRAWLLWFS